MRNRSSQKPNARTTLGATLLAGIITLPSIVAAEVNRFTDYARVDSVNPIYQTFTHRIPQETCWMETVRVDNPRPEHRSATGTIVGGIIGGAIGHAVGHKKSNKRVGAVVGSVLGMSIGHDISRQRAANRRYSSPRYEDVERCDVSYRNETEQKLVGYDVQYTYRGERYNTRMDSHPGKRIKLAVSVSPVSSGY